MAYHHGNLREALLERAADVIAERGVEDVSLRELARDLGVSHGAPRRHFPDRASLLAELARDGFRRAREAMDAAAEAAGDDPVARYRALGRAYVAFARENRCFFLASNHPSVLAAAGEGLRREQRAWMSMLRDGVEAARADGWQPGADVDALVAFSVAGAMGAATILSDPTWCRFFGKKDVDALADRVLDLIVHRSDEKPTARKSATSRPRASRPRTASASKAGRTAPARGARKTKASKNRRTKG